MNMLFKGDDKDNMQITPMKYNTVPQKKDGWKTASFLKWSLLGDILTFGRVYKIDSIPTWSNFNVTNSNKKLWQSWAKDMAIIAARLNSREIDH